MPSSFKDLLLYMSAYLNPAPLLPCLRVIWEAWCLMWSSKNKAQDVPVFSGMPCGWVTKWNLAVVLSGASGNQKGPLGWLVCFLIFKEMNYPAISHFKHSAGRDSADRYGERQSRKALALNPLTFTFLRRCRPRGSFSLPPDFRAGSQLRGALHPLLIRPAAASPPASLASPKGTRFGKQSGAGSQMRAPCFFSEAMTLSLASEQESSLVLSLKLLF